MKKISSFTVDHDRLERGIYVSRIDGVFVCAAPIRAIT